MQEARQSFVSLRIDKFYNKLNILTYFFEFTFLIGFIYGATKWGTFLISDLITGFILLVFFTNFHFQGNTRYKEEMIVFMVNLFFYAIVFISSLFIYFDKENEKRMYYIFPIFAYLIFIIIDPLDFDESFGSMYVPVFLAFFPVYFFKYYRKYIKEEV